MSKKVTAMESGQLTFVELAPKKEKEQLAVDPELIPEWELITTPQQLQQVLPQILACSAVGLDIETTGLSPHTDDVRLVQIAIRPDKVYICDMYALRNLSLLRPILEPKRPVKVIHNAAFELGFLYCRHQLPVRGIFDTLLASQLLHAGRSSCSHSLEAVAMRELGVMLDKELQLSNWERQRLSQAQLDYAALDAAILLPLREAMVRQLVEHDLVRAAKLEFDCVKAVVAMMYHGMKVDLDYLKQLECELTEQMLALEERLKDEFGPINFNSPQQLLVALKNRGIPATSTRERHLEALAESYPELRLVLEYRGVVKQLTSFVRPLQEHLSPLTGRIHPRFHQNGTVAGRMSCSRPNTQNFPRGGFRRVIVPERGCKLIIADYSQIELRIAAEIAGDETMIAAYKQGQDLHRLTASIISGKPVEEITKEERQKAKAVNFGLIYGMGAEGLVRSARYSYGVEITKAEAEDIIRSFFKNYWGLARWHRAIRREGPKAGHVCTLSGRKRFLDTDNIRVTELYNTPVQGTGADILKAALTRLHRRFSGTGIKIVNCVHDEVVVECPSELAVQTAAIVKKEMIAAGREFLKQVPLDVEVAIADSWAEK